MKRIVHFLAVKKRNAIPISREFYIDWPETILVWVVIGMVILLCVLARLNPLPPGAYPQPHPIP